MKSIIKILQSPLINVRGLEKKIGCPESTLHQAVKGHKKLPKKWLWPICREFAALGILVEGWKLDFDGMVFTAIKDRAEAPEVWEHQKLASGEVRKVEVSYEEQEAGEVLRSWFEYKQSQNRTVISDSVDLYEFLKAL